MKSPKAAPWVLGTAFLAVLILALAYMLLISPQLQTAAVARADAETAAAANVTHAARLATLQEQFADIDTYKAELASLQKQIPTTDSQPELLREVQAAADAAGVFVLGTNLGVPEVFIGAQGWDPTAVPAQAPAPPPAEGDSAAGGEAADGAAVATPTPEPAPNGVPGFVAMPFDVTVLGTYPNAVAFVQKVQEGMERLYVVTGFTVTGQDAAEPTGGRPATQKGDAEVLVQGYVYVLQEDAPADADVSTEVDADVTEN